MKVAFFSTKSYDKEYFLAFNKNFEHHLTFFDYSISESVSKNNFEGFDAICVFVNDLIDAVIVKKMAANGIKLIALRCAGFNNIDLKAAAQYNIKIVRVPAYSPQSVAEHAVALLMTLNRKTHKSYQRVVQNNFSLDHLTGFNVYKKTVGVIGTGLIGQAFCSIMLGFGCQVIAYDVVESSDLIKKGVVYKTLDEIYKLSDIISLHCPLVTQTHYLINSTAYEKMKNGVMLINTSRGAVIDSLATISALKSGKLGYLGIDVYENEQHLFFKDLSETKIEDDIFHSLKSFPNVLITGHQAFLTHEALSEISRTTLQNMTDFENGAVLKNEVK
ncbi:MAG: 2-hydroxyacid dehydrogenase [Cytophagales bacterium]|nr:MAG: 2-hydroxyacid dehydrogenase [Cytophagales bacterium]